VATLRRFGLGSREGAAATPRDYAWLGEAATWFVLGLAGMLMIFVGLAVDAYRHNNGAGEESLLSFGNPGHLVAAIGIGVTSFALLAGFSATMLRNLETADQAVRRLVPVAASWVLLAASGVGAITYIGATGVTVGHGHDDTTAAATDHPHDGGDADVAVALEDAGVLDNDDDVDPSSVRGALTQGASGHPDGRHDHGKHATFTQLQNEDADDLMDMFPDGLISDSELPNLRDEVLQVRAVAEELNTPDKATAAGYRQTTNDVPFMGEHWLNMSYVTDGYFDPTKPEGLLFSTLDGERKLVGVWFLQLPGICPKDGGECSVTREVEPAGFSGDLDLWHAHVGLCIVALSGASEGETRESCEGKGGRFTADLRWMMHVWVTPETTENADGFFAYLNSDLYAKQVAAKNGGADDAAGTIAP
jgi:hypothetical protein